MNKKLSGLIGLVLLLSSTSPARAENIWAGQPYFGLSAMLAAARNSPVDDASGSPHPAFSRDAELITQAGYGLSLHGGWLLDSNWRAELEISHRSAALDSISGPAGTASLDGDLALHTLFFNIARDFRGTAYLTPYVGAGVGVSLHNLDIKTVNGAAGLPDRSSVTPAFQALAGVLLEVGEDTDIVVGYRYVNYYAPDYSEFSNDYIDFHNFELGLRFYPEGW